MEEKKRKNDGEEKEEVVLEDDGGIRDFLMWMPEQCRGALLYEIGRNIGDFSPRGWVLSPASFVHLAASNPICDILFAPSNDFIRPECIHNILTPAFVELISRLPAATLIKRFEPECITWEVGRIGTMTRWKLRHEEKTDIFFLSRKGHLASEEDERLTRSQFVRNKFVIPFLLQPFLCDDKNYGWTVWREKNQPTREAHVKARINKMKQDVTFMARPDNAFSWIPCRTHPTPDTWATTREGIQAIKELDDFLTGFVIRLYTVGEYDSVAWYNEDFKRRSDILTAVSVGRYDHCRYAILPPSSLPDPHFRTFIQQATIQSLRHLVSSSTRLSARWIVSVSDIRLLLSQVLPYAARPCLPLILEYMAYLRS